MKKICLLFIALNVFSTSKASATFLWQKDSSDVILFVFSGSDWCISCIRLEKTVLSDTAFLAALQNEGITLRRIDFPQRKKLPPETTRYNLSIAEQFDFEGVYPSLVIFSASAKRYKKLQYQNEPQKALLARIISTAKILNE